MSESEKDTGFKVTDKRPFTEEGEARPENQTKDPTSEESSNATTDAGPAPGEPSQYDQHFQMTFETLVMSLSSTAMVQLGVIADPTTNQPAVNLEAAKQTIDILEILQQKSKGNLTESEGKLLDNILYELRMMFLEINQTIKVPK